MPEIRRTKTSGLYAAFAAAGCCLAAMVVFGSEGIHFFVGAVFMVIYGLTVDRNDRAAYDEQGMILYTIWGKPMPYHWSRITKVDTAVEQFRDRRFIIGPVLRICVKENNGKQTVYRFPFKYYTGIAEFLAFVNCKVHK